LSSTFVVTDGPMRGILPCIDAAVRELKKGEKAVLTAPTGWAYASPEYVPPPGGIPTGAVERTSEGVEVELELVDFERGHDFYALSGDEKVAEMTKYREAGNRLFRANFIERAIKRYDEALRKEAQTTDFLDVADADKEAKLDEVKKQKISLHLNLAAAHLKLNDAKAALSHCDRAVGLDATHVKALYRRGQARLLLGDIEDARSDLMHAAKREPQNKDVRRELEKLKTHAAAQKSQQRQVFGGIFS